MKKHHTLALTLALFFSGTSYAIPAINFTTTNFMQLSKSGHLVVVGFHSDSCGSCKVQKPNLEALLKEPGFSEIHGLMANFEATKNFRDSLAKPVRGPSTVVLFKDGKELSRIQGITNKDKLRELILAESH